jgi:hypothetical protein
VCTFCGYATAYKHNLTKHVKTMHLMIKDKVCDKCDFATSYAHLLINHKKEVHCSIKTLRKTRGVNAYGGQCPYCKFSSSKNRHLTNHIKTSHSNALGIGCDRCDYVGLSRELLLIHKRLYHLPVGQEACGQCDFTSPSRHKMSTHQKMAHAKVLQFVCDTCDYSTHISKHQLNMHIKTKHLKKCHTCDLCVFDTSYSASLEKHNAELHNNLRVNKICLLCGLVADNLQTLESHIRYNHKNIETITCKDCSFKTNHGPTAKAHRDTVHQCRFCCDFTSATLRKLLCHMYDKCEKGRLVRKKKKPGKDHMCEECGYASYSLWYLKRHLRQAHERKKVQN